jgi:hypothetical protein
LKIEFQIQIKSKQEYLKFPLTLSLSTCLQASTGQRERVMASKVLEENPQIYWVRM